MGASALIAAGTSAAIDAWVDGTGSAELAGAEPPPLDPPHAASKATGTRSAIPARRESLTVRPMCDPQKPRTVQVASIVDFHRIGVHRRVREELIQLEVADHTQLPTRCPAQKATMAAGSGSATGSVARWSRAPPASRALSSTRPPASRRARLTL